MWRITRRGTRNLVTIRVVIIFMNQFFDQFLFPFHYLSAPSGNVKFYRDGFFSNRSFPLKKKKKYLSSLKSSPKGFPLCRYWAGKAVNLSVPWHRNHNYHVEPIYSITMFGITACFSLYFRN